MDIYLLSINSGIRAHIHCDERSPSIYGMPQATLAIMDPRPNSEGGISQIATMPMEDAMYWIKDMCNNWNWFQVQNFLIH